MVIKVQYDAYNRTLKLVDQEFRTLLEGDALYDLAIPLMFEEADVFHHLAPGRDLARSGISEEKLRLSTAIIVAEQ